MMSPCVCRWILGVYLLVTALRLPTRRRRRRLFHSAAGSCAAKVVPEHQDRASPKRIPKRLGDSRSPPEAEIGGQLVPWIDDRSLSIVAATRPRPHSAKPYLAFIHATGPYIHKGNHERN